MRRKVLKIAFRKDGRCDFVAGWSSAVRGWAGKPTGANRRRSFLRRNIRRRLAASWRASRPAIDLAAEKRVIDCLVALASAGTRAVGARPERWRDWRCALAESLLRVGGWPRVAETQMRTDESAAGGVCAVRRTRSTSRSSPSAPDKGCRSSARVRDNMVYGARAIGKVTGTMPCASNITDRRR